MTASNVVTRPSRPRRCSWRALLPPLSPESDLPSQSSLSGVQLLGAPPHSGSRTQPQHHRCGPGSAWLFLRRLCRCLAAPTSRPKICCPAAVLLLLWLPPPSLPPPISVMVAGPRGVEPPVDAVSDSHLKAKQVHAGCRGGQLCWNSYANISNTQIRDATLSVHYRSSAGSATTVKPRSDKHQ